MRIKIVREKDKIIGHLRLLDGSKIDLSYNEKSKIVLLGFKECILKTSLARVELKEKVEMAFAVSLNYSGITFGSDFV
nr:hypothetical protein [Candidatus Baldrarchaeota archaeon]